MAGYSAVLRAGKIDRRSKSSQVMRRNYGNVGLLGLSFFVHSSMYASGERCTVCPQGEAPPDPDKTVTGSTCGDLENKWWFGGLQGETCSTAQLSFGFGQCGCRAPEGACTVCPDGSRVKDPDREILEGKTTCRQLELAALVAPTDQCFSFYVGALPCGCFRPAPEDRCQLCEGGVAPSNPDGVGDNDYTCRILSETVSFLEDGSIACDSAQAFGRAFCGCPKECTLLCDADEGLEPVEPVARWTDASTGSVYNCSELNETVPALLEGQDEKNCPVWWATAGVHCGCSDVTAPGMDTTCDMCSDTLLPNPPESVMGDSGDKVSCGALEYFASLNDDKCSEYQSQYSSACCRMTAPHTEDIESASGGFGRHMLSLAQPVTTLFAAFFGLAFLP